MHSITMSFNEAAPPAISIPIADRSRQDCERTVRNMFENAMSEEWKKVAKTYAESRSLQVAVNAQTGDTVLHLAVSSGVESNVRLLLNSIGDEDNKAILEIQNERGDTPLHLAAAALGLEEACQAMFSRCPQLVIEARNKQGETPLFKAARHGQMKAFSAMQYIIEDVLHITKEGPRNLHFCRNIGGDTILHIALFEDHYDLALKIIDCYSELVSYYNEKGESPLHILAKKPWAFKSGAHFGPLETLTYRSETLSQYILSLSPGPRGEKDQASQKNPEIQNRGFHNSYIVQLKCFKFVRVFLLCIIKIVIWQRIDFIKIMEQKKTHTRACQIMKKLLDHWDEWDFGKAGKLPRNDWLKLGPSQLPVRHVGPEMEQKNEQENIQEAKGEVKNESEQQKTLTSPTERPVGETPLLIAAKNGIEELVESILKRFPIALLDLDTDEKNILLLAVEHRQSNIYELLWKRKEMRQSVFGKVDKDGNSAVHLAAAAVKAGLILPQIIPGAALRMQWEVKWYKYVEKSMDPNFFPRRNCKGVSARDIFTKAHEDLVKQGHDWLTKTSKSCSVVAALIATVAFATASSLPGGVNQSTGFPLFQGQKGFHVFAIFALVALCFSVTSLVMFLSFLTSRYEQWDFETDLPLKLIVNLTSLFLSIAAMLISFCAGHFFVINNLFKQPVHSYPLYAAVCWPVYSFATAQFPLYVGLIRATFARVPARAVPGP